MQIVSVVYGRLEATAPWGLKLEAEAKEKDRNILLRVRHSSSPISEC
jgi:hypothetical protein